MSKPEQLSSSEIATQLTRLNQSTEEKWQLLDGKLHKKFVFRNFTSAMAFMQSAAEQAETMNHHPEWCNTYNRVAINLVTHSVNGISSLDFELAKHLDEIS